MGDSVRCKRGVARDPGASDLLMPLKPKTTTNATLPTGMHGRASRRTFCSGAAAVLLARGGMLRAASFAAQVSAGPAAPATRPEVAAIDHDRILAAAQRYVTQPPTPLTSLPCPRSPGTPHDYYSEAEAAPVEAGS